MKKTILGLFVAAVCAARTVSAAPITIAYDTFGAFPIATFGGVGNPTNPVAVTTIHTSGGDTITLGLAAQQRYLNPALTNDGAGTYFALAGGDVNDPPNSNPLYARWNFDFYASQTGGNYLYEIEYDFNPSVNTDQSQLGQAYNTGTGSVTAQDSWNDGFAFLAANSLGIVAPVYEPFNPSVAGQYSFALIAKTMGGVELGRPLLEFLSH